MSVTNKRVTSPVTKYIRYRASESKNGNGGVFYYYDKETDKNIELDMPFKFIDIAAYSTVVGWNKDKQSTIYANEVLNTGEQKMVVKFQKGGVIAEGIYRDIKDVINSAGGDFAIAIYAIYNKEVVKIILKGVAAGAWINREQGDIVTCDSTYEDSNGATTYKVPVFKGEIITDEQEEQIRENYPLLFSYIDDKESKLQTIADVSEEQPSVAAVGVEEPEEFEFEKDIADDGADKPMSGDENWNMDKLDVKEQFGDDEEEEVKIEDVPF